MRPSAKQTQRRHCPNFSTGTDITDPEILIPEDLCPNYGQGSNNSGAITGNAMGYRKFPIDPATPRRSMARISFPCVRGWCAAGPKD